jgi:hypothetical protein
MTVPTIDPESGGMMVVAEGHGLGEDEILAGHVSGVRPDPSEVTESSQHNDSAKHRKTRESVCAPMKKL